jgi:hypothetical protein
MEFEGIFFCRHPLPDAGKSSGQGSSCFPCRGTNIKCAPLPSTFMTVFDPAYGIRTRYQAACEVLTIPNVPNPVAIAVADEFQRIMKLMVSSRSDLNPRRESASELTFAFRVGSSPSLEQDRLSCRDPMLSRLARCQGQVPQEVLPVVVPKAPVRRQRKRDRHHPRS